MKRPILSSIFFDFIFEKEASSAFVIEGSSGRILAANGAAEIEFGYSRRDLLSMTYSSLKASDHSSPAADTKSGSVLPSGRTAFIRTGSGPVIRVGLDRRKISFDGIMAELFIVRSSRGKTADRALDFAEDSRTDTDGHDIKNRDSAILGSLPGFIYFCSGGPEWRISFASPACGRITGYGPEDIAAAGGLAFDTLIAPEYWPVILDRTLYAISRKEPYEYEYQLVRADGRRIWVWDRGQGVFGANGALLSVGGYLEDITPRHEAEEKLQELNRDLARRLSESTVINRMSRDLLTLISPERIGQEITSLLKGIPGYDRIDLFKLEHRTSRLIPIFSEGWFDQDGRPNDKARAIEAANYSENRFKLGVGITGACAETGRSIVVDDVTLDPRYIPYLPPPSPDPVRSEICVPATLADGQIIGLLNVESFAKSAFGGHDRIFLETISALTAGVMENARLYQDAERRTAFLSAISEAITESDKARVDMPAFLDLVLENVLKAFGLDEGLIELRLPAAMEAADLGGSAVFRGIDRKALVEVTGLLVAHESRFEGTMSVTGFTMIDDDDPDRETLSAMGISASIRIPLRTTEDKDIGVLAMFSRTPRIWTAEESSLLETMGAQLAMAIEMALLNIHNRRRLLELETINTVSAALRTAGNEDEMLPLLLDRTLDALGTNSGQVWLYDGRNNVTRSVVCRGWFRSFDEMAPLSSEVGIHSHVIKAREPYITAEFHDDPLMANERRAFIPKGWSGAIVPIMSEASVWGGMTISLPCSRPFSQLDVKLLTSLAEMAGTALHRMNLFSQTTRRLASLQSLRSIDRTIISSFDLKITLDFILEQVLAQLGVDAAGIRLLDRQQMTMNVAASRGFLWETYSSLRVQPGDDEALRSPGKEEAIVLEDPDELRRVVDANLLATEAFRAFAAVPLISKGEVLGTLEVFFRRRPEFDKEWKFLFETLAGQAAIAIDNSIMFSDLKRSHRELALAYDATIEGWAYALDLRDQGTEFHARRVTDIAVRLAREAGLPPEQLPHFRRGALLHDMGKMSVPDAVLLKPGPLNDEEREIMKRHPRTAMEMLSRIEYLRPALDIPYCHHERWDGTGYPRGLRNEQIPFSARIFALADVYDALISDRPYRKAWPKAKAIEHIRSQSGKHFDPRVVEIFLSMISRNAL